MWRIANLAKVVTAVILGGVITGLFLFRWLRKSTGSSLKAQESCPPPRKHKITADADETKKRRKSEFDEEVQPSPALCEESKPTKQLAEDTQLSTLSKTTEEAGDDKNVSEFRSQVNEEVPEVLGAVRLEAEEGVRLDGNKVEKETSAYDGRSIGRGAPVSFVEKVFVGADAAGKDAEAGAAEDAAEKTSREKTESENDWDTHESEVSGYAENDEEQNKATHQVEESGADSDAESDASSEGYAEEKAEEKAAEISEEMLLELRKATDELRQLGNEAFKQQEYPKAFELYTDAIEKCPESEKQVACILLNNRAACHLMTGNNEGCIEDTTEAIECDPDNPKPYLRRYRANNALKKYHDALADLTKYMELDPEGGKAFTGARKKAEQLSKEQFEKEKEEMVGKLKDFGNWALGKVGLSLDNFKVEQNPETGSYNISFNQGAPSQEQQ